MAEDPGATDPASVPIENRIILARRLIRSGEHPQFQQHPTCLFTTEDRKATSGVDKVGVRVKIGVPTRKSKSKNDDYDESDDEEDDDNDDDEIETQVWFLCLFGTCGAECLGNGLLRKISKTSTGQATRHLLDKHGVVTPKTSKSFNSF